MNRKDFEVIVEKRLELIKKVLENKQAEYANIDNVFHNFETAARIKEESKEKSLYGMMIKHFISVIDMIAQPETSYTPEHIDEKIGDVINYLIILEAMLKEDSSNRWKSARIEIENQHNVT